MKKKTLTKKEQALKDEFDKMMARHAKPLERGAKAKGQVVKSPPPSKRGMPLLEAGRVSREPSLDTGYHSTALKEQKRYTGDKIVGLATMHKSNMVPVFNEEGAKDIARMRR